MRKGLSWLLKTGAAVFLGGVTCIAVLLLLMWGEHKIAITLPAPTGHFPVARTTFAWTNNEATAEVPSAPGSKRQVLVWMWYPASPSYASPQTEYLPAPWRAALAKGQGRFLRSFFKRDPAVVRTHSVSDAPVSSEQARYPVVLLRSGGSALTTDFTTLAENLASHGFFVVGFDAPYRSFVVVLPDGRTVNRYPAYNVENANGNLADPLIGKLLAMWIADTKFVADQLQRMNDDPASRFAGRIDLGRLGMFGHSFGGATALQFCHEDARCKAAVDMDGIPFGSVVQQGLEKPCMFLMSDHSRERPDPSSRQILSEIQSIYDRAPAEERWHVVIRTANHFSFSDQILLNSHIATRILSSIIGFGRLDGRRGLAISADYVQTFFDVYLNGAPASSLADMAKKYSEVQVGSPGT